MVAKKSHTESELFSLAIKALPKLPDITANSFETGERGHAVEKLVHYLILEKVPGLDVSKEIRNAEQVLQGAYAGSVAPGSEAAFAKADIAAVRACIDGYLGERPDAFMHYTLADIKKEATDNHYPNLEALGLQFSERHPKPFRSSLIEPKLLQRVEGLETDDMVAQAIGKLGDGYIGVPKANGPAVQDSEAAMIAKIAAEKTEAAINEMLGKQIKR